MVAPVQASGSRPSRALPYALGVDEDRERGAVALTFRNHGGAGAVFHVYDRLHLDRPPRRYTVGPGGALRGVWEAGGYDLWILGPNGFHRHLIGEAGGDDLSLSLTQHPDRRELVLTVANPAAAVRTVEIADAYASDAAPWTAEIAPGSTVTRRWSVAASRGWYDLSLSRSGAGGYIRRLAGRLETGADSISDPAMGGPAVMDQA
jgi:phospholipase C